MFLVQVLLPLTDNQGVEFPKEKYKLIMENLTTAFGGVTAYYRSPAKGLWKDDSQIVMEDEIVIYEVMVNTFDNNWWSQYKEILKQEFGQEDIVIRTTGIYKV